jgi:integrase
MYTSVLGSFFRDVVGDRDLDQVGLEEMEKWTVRPRTGGRAGNGVIEPSDATVSRDVAIVRSFYTWAVPRGHATIDTSKGLHGPVVNNERPRPLSDADWRAWWSAPLPLEARAVLALGYVCGLRREEIVRLRDTQVTGEHLRGVVRKGKGRVVVDVPYHIAEDVLSLPVSDVLCAATARQEGLLIVPWLEATPDEGTKRTQRLSRWLERLGNEHGLPRFTIHQLRHACVTNLLRAGMPIQHVRGFVNHTNIQTTLRYGDSGEEVMVEWLRGR